MNNIPLFSSDINLYYEATEGLRVECSEKHAALLRGPLTEAGFAFDSQRTSIKGNSNIHNLIEIGLSGGSFETLIEVISRSLVNEGYDIVKESFSLDEGDKHVRLNLTNDSVYDNISPNSLN